jgi:hypothetical protein
MFLLEDDDGWSGSTHLTAFSIFFDAIGSQARLLRVEGVEGKEVADAKVLHM